MKNLFKFFILFFIIFLKLYANDEIDVILKRNYDLILHLESEIKKQNENKPVLKAIKELFRNYDEYDFEEKLLKQLNVSNKIIKELYKKNLELENKNEEIKKEMPSFKIYLYVFFSGFASAFITIFLFNLIKLAIQISTKV